MERVISGVSPFNIRFSLKPLASELARLILQAGLSKSDFNMHGLAINERQMLVADEEVRSLFETGSFDLTVTLQRYRPVGSPILIVDHEAAVRETLALYLRRKGFEISTAMTGTAAKDLLEMMTFALVILDADLGQESGLELLQFLNSRYPQMPFLLFSGTVADEDLPRRAAAAGAKGFVHKTDPLQILFTQVCLHIRDTDRYRSLQHEQSYPGSKLDSDCGRRCEPAVGS